MTAAAPRTERTGEGEDSEDTETILGNGSVQGTYGKRPAGVEPTTLQGDEPAVKRQRREGSRARMDDSGPALAKRSCR
jgi:hypothetical protein